MSVDQYMKDHFPSLILRPPLFYSWDIGIRFELGDPHLYDVDKNQYMDRVYSRSIELFKELFVKDDDLLLVTNAYFAYKLKNQIKKVNLYRRYIKNRQILWNLKLNVIPDIFAEPDEIPDEDNKTYRFQIACKVSDLDYLNLIKAICNKDLGTKPSIKHDVFFINLGKGIIFHIYDDRGCDVVSNSTSVLKNIFIKYNDWILNYDRESINKIFEGII
ncbi:DUF3885 domain-containing protein [Paenibacillus sp. 453mf]|uniref:DUF3885 domain-containing protein n=1 Tax=Paenibacillus sp. 453mf TaxID=1761874 RepID=UPI0008EC0A25|nr:DUF3885 domain-containing protein [Paenibacillus sp. 453mf]SFS56852.1 protein of unknown function [Paenibacillus sp. 453mf]